MMKISLQQCLLKLFSMEKDNQINTVIMGKPGHKSILCTKDNIEKYRSKGYYIEVEYYLSDKEGNFIWS